MLVGGVLTGSSEASTDNTDGVHPRGTMLKVPRYATNPVTAFDGVIVITSVVQAPVFSTSDILICHRLKGLRSQPLVVR